MSLDRNFESRRSSRVNIGIPPTRYGFESVSRRETQRQSLAPEESIENGSKKMSKHETTMKRSITSTRSTKTLSTESSISKKSVTSRRATASQENQVFTKNYITIGETMEENMKNRSLENESK
ncbi:hypothetical protein JTB14_019350 [Gonioctena quinquepunctata]|nr:hypothetical protein JTB14_019350 [Gonioctena quinquepunctata]